ncbi:MAG: hypothetical protein V7K88_05415 [Nostoc sp.]
MTPVATLRVLQKSTSWALPERQLDKGNPSTPKGDTFAFSSGSPMPHFHHSSL